jgi:hypothetical protein
MLFTQNAANSSLRDRARCGFGEPTEGPNLNRDVVLLSYFPPSLLPSGINHAFEVK